MDSKVPTPYSRTQKKKNGFLLQPQKDDMDAQRPYTQVHLTCEKNNANLEAIAVQHENELHKRHVIYYNKNPFFFFPCISEHLAQFAWRLYT